MKKLLLSLAVVAMAAAMFTGCVKKDFDNPPDTSGYDPNLPVTHTIAQLKAMNGPYVSSTVYDTTLLTEDVVVSGIVAADDRSGNYYKQIVIQDSTGGIAINMDAYSLYNEFPVGRKVYVKCRGLYLGYNGGTPEIGGSVNQQKSLNGILGGDISRYIVKASVGHTVKDTVVSFAAIKAVNSSTNPLINRLVTIQDSVEFVSPMGLSYTDPTATTNRLISTCAGASSPSTITVRTSNYADFNAIPLPTGRGHISGILTIYKTFSTTPQIILRDTNDVRMYNPNRCGGIVVVPTGTAISLDSVRKLYVAPGIKLGSYTIHGTVVSDYNNKNIGTGNILIQDGLKGINIYAGATAAALYNLGDSLTINVTGDSLKIYAGMMEIEASASQITKVGSGKSVTIRTVDLATLTANFTQYEATVVKVNNATASGGTTYSGNRTLTDATGTIVLRTATTATFAASTMPTTPKSFTGIASWFNTTKQLQMRNLTDVQ